LAILGALLHERLVSPDDRASPASLAAVSACLAEVHETRYEIRAFLVHERLQRLEAVQAGLSCLRKVQDPDRLLGGVCEAAARSCGFERVMLSRVKGSVWQPWESYAPAGGEQDRAFLCWINTRPEIRLDHLLVESEMIRRREPVLVTGGEDDQRVHQPLVAASGQSSYVAAPLMPGGRVIGFLHAGYRSRKVTLLDRDTLWAFAEAFSQIFERAVLLERLRGQREQVRSALRAVEAALEDHASAEIDLSGREQVRASTGRSAATARIPELASDLESVLTDRELEVLALMADGATNNRIAEQLVIAHGTVKSHVKRILRKLGVENRAEAVSRYLRLTMGGGRP